MPVGRFILNWRTCGDVVESKAERGRLVEWVSSYKRNYVLGNEFRKYKRSWLGIYGRVIAEYSARRDASVQFSAWWKHGHKYHSLFATTEEFMLLAKFPLTLLVEFAVTQACFNMAGVLRTHRGSYSECTCCGLQTSAHWMLYLFLYWLDSVEVSP